LTLSSLGGGPEAVKLLPWFTAYETSGRMEPLMAWWERNAKEISRMRVERAPPPAAVLRAVLEFKFLSRNIASKPSMAGIRVSRLLLSLREDRCANPIDSTEMQKALSASRSRLSEPGRAPRHRRVIVVSDPTLRKGVKTAPKFN
jgi:hypothetical protein